MKKLVLSLVATGLLSTAAFAASGGWEIGVPYKIESWNNSTVYYMKKSTDATCLYKFVPAGMDADQLKLVNAMFLTAQSAGKGIQIYLDDTSCSADENAAPKRPHGIKMVEL